MNQLPKLECVISDLDGSLLNSQKKVSPKDLETIRKLKEKGILFFISTGRSFPFACEAVGSVGFDLPASCCNGGHIYDFARKKGLACDPLEKEVACKALDWLLTTEHPFIIYATTGVYFRNRTMARYILWEKWNRNAPEGYRFTMPTVEDGQLDRENTTFIKILLTEANAEVYRQLMEAMGEDAKKLNPVFSEPTLLDVNAAGVNKGKGVQRLSELFGFNTANTMAIGDNFNDITLLQSVGIPVAPANAEEQIKSMAKYITCSNNDSPLTYAIEHLYPGLLD